MGGCEGGMGVVRHVYYETCFLLIQNKIAPPQISPFVVELSCPAEHAGYSSSSVEVPPSGC